MRSSIVRSLVKSVNYPAKVVHFSVRPALRPATLWNVFDRNPVGSLINEILSADEFDPVSRRLPLGIKETDKGYDIEVDVPGVKKEDVKVVVKDHILTITTERSSIEDTNKENEGGYRREERFYGMSERSLALPESADEKHVTADYNHGKIIQFLKLNCLLISFS